MNTFNSLLITSFLTAVLFQSAQGATYNTIVTLAEDPGQFNSMLTGARVQTFDNLTGLSTNVVWEGVGTFDKLNVINANQYGGAPSETLPNGTPYAVTGLGSVKTTTLTLNEASSYFGMYWSAGDALNDLKFYSNGELVANFTTSNLMNLLPTAYYGNPIESGPFANKNVGEPYAFINFLGDANTSWDTIVFSNNGSSGFEGDNYTSRVEGWNPAADGEITGKPVISLTTDGGTQTVSRVTSTSTDADGNLVLDVVNTQTGARTVSTFAPAAPAAPAPPLMLIAAFGAAIAIKGLQRKNGTA
jgi:hypothetical protein